MLTVVRLQFLSFVNRREPEVTTLVSYFLSSLQKQTIVLPLVFRFFFSSSCILPITSPLVYKDLTILTQWNFVLLVLQETFSATL